MNLDFYPNEIIETGFVKLRIEAVGGDLDRVACRYPRSFLDEMARQLTSEIENALGVEGLAESSVELVMAFAYNTYLEHISENVTYRRLLLMDKVSAPRDFWVKWTRLAADITEYHSGNIRFELGEDVEQKIREKEYRYLLESGKDSYHNSMGRKKVTEWREVVKRAAKRGELTKIESDFELTPETLELEARIADLLGKKGVQAPEPEKEEIPYIHSDDNEFEQALAKMRQVVESMEAENFEAEDTVFEIAEDEIVEPEEMQEEESEMQNEDEELLIFEEITPPEAEDEFIEFEELEKIEEIQSLEFEIQNDEPANEIIEEFEIGEPEIEEIEAHEIGELEIEETEIAEPEIEEPVEEAVEEPKIEEPVNEMTEEPEAVEVEEPIATPIADRAAYIRAEIEAKIRLEYESKARIKAEEELIALRCEYHSFRNESELLLAEAKRELERLRLEYSAFVEETRRREMMRKAAEAQRMAEERELRAQIEIQLREEAQERERLEAAARMAIEEKRRLEAEHARIARQREEQELIEAENRRRIEEERAREAYRQAEAERVRREEEESRAKAAMPEMGDGRYVYTSKSVKLIFRRSVDPNITTRIHEIIKATVEYYGKDRVYLKIKAMVTDSQTVVLEFEQIPLEEMALLGNIIKILGNSGLGIAKAIIE